MTEHDQFDAAESVLVATPALSEAALPCPALPQPPYAFAGDSWAKLAKLPNVRFLGSSPSRVRAVRIFVRKFQNAFCCRDTRIALRESCPTRRGVFEARVKNVHIRYSNIAGVVGVLSDSG